MEDNRHPLIILAGPTAVGKTAASVALAKRFSGSIVSADSVQVYKYLDIGSAKVTKEEMQGIPHYLIDCIDPKEEWNVFRFQKEAKAAIRKIEEAGRLPFLVGGTGFYIQSVLYDIDFTSEDTDKSVRARWQDYAKTNGDAALWEALRLVDPESAAAIDPHNEKRLIRALEYYESTGERISEHNKKEREKPAAYDALFFVLTMRDRAALYDRIEKRVDQMMEEGLLEEVKHLRDLGLEKTDLSMQALGYRQLFSYLEGDCTLEEAVQEIKTQTRHFAKRQLTWFRRERDVTWVYADDYPTREDLVEVLAAAVRSHYHL
ncbi:MAG: tRNA (adenosine(37)-N6)-dimethylallyltransferase MiaA [Lachnospiraceae bacterium]